MPFDYIQYACCIISIYSVLGRENRGTLTKRVANKIDFSVSNFELHVRRRKPSSRGGESLAAKAENADFKASLLSFSFLIACVVL